MRQRSVGSLVVVDRDSQVVGVITDRDLTVRVVTEGLCPSDTLVDQVMTAPPVTVGEDCSLEHALSTMRVHKFRRLPVVDQGQRIKALITVDDILMSLARDFQQVAQVVMSEIPSVIADRQQFAGPTRFRNETRIP
jgi:signal-transduction protein with cAMP-binding, CBS, and nucleotidyltransferase domain